MNRYTIYLSDHETNESISVGADDLEGFYYATLRALEGLNRHHGAILEAMHNVVKREYRPRRRPASQKEAKQTQDEPDGNPAP